MYLQNTCLRKVETHNFWKVSVTENSTVNFALILKIVFSCHMIKNAYIFYQIVTLLSILTGFHKFFHATSKRHILQYLIVFQEVKLMFWSEWKVPKKVQINFLIETLARNVSLHSILELPETKNVLTYDLMSIKM